MKILACFDNTHTVHHFVTHFDKLESEFEKKLVGVDLVYIQLLAAAYAVQEKTGLDLCKLGRQPADSVVEYGNHADLVGSSKEFVIHGPELKTLAS